ncbi:MAG: sulfatase, partial [Planctomycetota bacterium]
RLSDLPVVADGKLHNHLQPLDGLRGVGDATDALAGLAELELRWLPAGDGAEVAIEHLTLFSVFDAPGGGAFTTSRLRRGWVEREGLAVRVPAQLELVHERRGEERLRVGLAVIGGHGARVTLAAGDAVVTVDLSPGAAWRETELDLAGLPEDEAGTIRLGVEPGSTRSDGAADAAGEPVVLCGSPMILRRESGPPRAPVILYVEDTLGASHLSLYGYGPSTDPFLSELAGQGVTVERARAPSPWTRPSLSSLLTGRTPLGHGNRDYRRRVPDALTTLPEVLAEAGWITVSLVTNYHAGRWAGLHQGFDLHHEPEAFGLPLPADTLTAGRVHARLAELLEQYEGLPLFVFAHALDPHAPYEPPSEELAALVDDPAGRPSPPPSHADAGRFDVETLAYDAEVLHVDGWLAALDEALTARGLADDTLFVFTSDHGEAFGEHGLWEHHQSLHDVELWVPLVLRWPGRLPRGARVDVPLTLTDVAPTLLGLLELDAPAAWEGADLSAMLRGEDRVTQRPLLLDVVYNFDQPQVGEELGLVQGDSKLIARVQVDGSLAATALFRLDEDPGERRNLLDDPAQADRRDGLLRLLEQARTLAAPLPDGEAAAMDPTLAEWMRAMGYLR